VANSPDVAEQIIVQLPRLRNALVALALAAMLPGAYAQQPRAAAAGTPAIVLHGAGATFPAPLYKKWAVEFNKANPGVKIDYKDVGSGEGVKRFLDKSVDFGASDSAMSDEQLAAAKPGATLVPVTAGMVVLAYNLPGLNGPLKLSRATYVDLLAGRIPKWNDARIQAINPGLNLPNKNIALVARQDGSGTTFALSNHLNAASDKWRERGLGVGTVIAWSGTVMLARGNEGVAARVKVSEGSIGYVEYGFAKRLGLPMAHLENKAGRYVAPGEASGQAAIAAGAGRMPANLRLFLPDPEGDDSYPIVSLTWLLLYDRYQDQAKADALRRFVGWALGEGQTHGAALGYVGLPAALVERSRIAAESIR
jgi:phosphate transport system substrate-binding protein